MPLTNNQLNEELLTKNERIALAEDRLAYFTVRYLSHYIKSEVPAFHREIYNALQDGNIKLLELIAFRGSGKSTIASLALPLWAAIFKKRNFILLISDTFGQSKQIISNLIYELEYNEKLHEDFGTFKTKDQEWTATNILLKNNVRITSKSRGQKVRGLRHLQYRPDLVIVDDVENIEDVRSKEQRDKTNEWLNSDVVPATDANGKLVLVGNLLHNDSLYARYRNLIVDTKNGVYKEYPLFDKTGNNVWVSEYPPERVAVIRASIGKRFFEREYMLNIVPPDDQVVSSVLYYDTLPKFDKISLGVDLAISQKATADYTSINVTGRAGDNFYNIQNKYGRWNFNQTLENINTVYNEIKGKYVGVPLELGIEDVAYQKAAIEELTRRYKIKVTPVKQSIDKRSRLETLVPYFENKQIYFRRSGQEDLIDQLLNFGAEQHDDCVDAFEIAMRLLLDKASPQIRWL